MYWYWIHVYNNDLFIGSFYTESSKKEDIVKEIYVQYGGELD